MRNPHRMLGTILVVLSIATPADAYRNLVPNPSFEERVPAAGCPERFSQFDMARFWNQPTGNHVIGTADYFHTCGAELVGVSSNFFGDQTARTGSAYAGVAVFVYDEGYREYVQVPLLEPLEAGHTYRVEFHVSLADAASFAIEEIGAHFSIAPVDDHDSYSPLQITPHIEQDGGILSDPDDWTKISGNYTAAGGERYLTIGNFRTDALTTWSTVTPDPELALRLRDAAYYYLDDVAVEEICPDEGSVLTFASAACSGPGEIDVTPLPYDVGDYRFQSLAGPSTPLRMHCDESPDYACEPGLHVESLNQTPPGFAISVSMTRTNAQPFSVCTMGIAEGEIDSSQTVISDVGDAQLAMLDGVLGAPEVVHLIGFDEIMQLYSLDYVDVQWTHVCACPSGPCPCPSTTPELGASTRYCVDGDGTGTPWSWRIDSGPIVNMLASFGTAQQLAEQLIFSINTHPSYPDAEARLLLSHAAGERRCLKVFVKDVTTASLLVGDLDDPICSATAQPTGCIFNPTLTNAEFLPLPAGTNTPLLPLTIPALPAAAVGSLAALLLGTAASRRARTRRSTPR